MMDCVNYYVLRLWIVMVLVSVCVLEVKRVEGGVSGRQCQEERRVGVSACTGVLTGKNPTAECCNRIRVSHVECVCPILTPQLAALIDVNRAIRIVQGCGRRVPRHFKCGSITTP